VNGIIDSTTGIDRIFPGTVSLKSFNYILQRTVLQGCLFKYDILPKIIERKAFAENSEKATTLEKLRGYGFSLENRK
jgi:hypothetical protein